METTIMLMPHEAPARRTSPLWYLLAALLLVPLGAGAVPLGAGRRC